MAQFNPLQMNATQLMTMMQMMMEQIKPILQQVGIEIDVEKVVLYPKDQECIVKLSDGKEVNLCIDYVWRIKCQLPQTCEQLRELIKQELG